MTQKPVRIRDVAAAAGVSTATVSRALSNPEMLSESTREIVFGAVRETGYRVNQAARNLRMKRAGSVLVLVPNLGNPFFSQILAGISSEFANSDYSVLISDTENGYTGKNLVDFFLDGRIDGLISLDGNVSQSQLDALQTSGVAKKVIYACEWVEGSKLPSVRSDNDKGARLAVRHLFGLGHRKIAHITGPDGNMLTQARLQGMIQERDLLGADARDDWIIKGDFSLISGQDAGHRIIAMDDRPTAVFCASDMIAFGLISTLAEAGISVPKDISVVGFDDIMMSGYYIPALTTIRQDRFKMGTNAARLLLKQLGAEPTRADEGHVELIDVELVIRSSTSKYKDTPV